MQREDCSETESEEKKIDILNFIGTLRHAFSTVNPVITVSCGIMLLVLLVLLGSLGCT